MKKEIAVTERPEIFTEQYLAAFGNMSWYDFVTAMPSLVFVVTGWKSNGKENACLHSWSSFAGSGADNFICILGKVNKDGHMYQSLKETKACVLNFPSNDIYDRCIKTIGNNQFETDEITASGLTAEGALNICMDSERYDQRRLGRYGKNGFLFQIDQPTNPETGETTPFGPGIVEQGKPVPWITE